MNNIYAWVLATRPKTLTASIVPVIVGTLLAFNVKDQVNAYLALWMLLSAIGIQIGTNLINDALDFKKGADTSSRIGPKRVTQSGLIPFKVVLRAGFVSLFVAFVFGIPLIMHGGVVLLIILLISVALAYLYTGGPYPLAYFGLGDLFVFLFFGLVSTSVAYSIQTGNWDRIAFLAGTQVGLLATSLIAVNNLRDHKDDERANKRTLAVQFGVLFSRIEITLLIILPFILGFLWLPSEYTMVAWLPLILLPLAINIIRSIWKLNPSEKYNDVLASCASLQLLFAICLCVGFYFEF